MYKQLTGVCLSGYKSIKKLDDFELRSINILIGQNGAGKSNFISFFKLLNWMTGGTGGLQSFVGKGGGAALHMFEGPKTTSQVQAHLKFQAPKGLNEYKMALARDAADKFVFMDEGYNFTKTGYPVTEFISLGSGHKESMLIEEARSDSQTAKTASYIYSLLKQCAAFQFHDTSDEAKIKQHWNVNENMYLRGDGANLAPYLLWIRENHPRNYRLIVRTLKMIAPFFEDFILEPDSNSVLLRWNETGSDMNFVAGQASDGTLRTMALITLLLQPEEKLPSVMIIDEPELGLHPSAITILSGMIKSVSNHCQVILATQSSAFIDHFEPEHIIVVEREGRESTFRRLVADELAGWRENYSMGEIWEKNIIGGRP